MKPEEIQATVKEYVMKRFPLHINARIPFYGRALSDSANYRVFVDPVMNELLIQLRVYLLRNKHMELESGKYNVPASWWQMLKRDKFPKWFIKRWPVQLKEHTHFYEKNVWICPHSDIPFGNEEHFRFLRCDLPRFGGPR